MVGAASADVSSVPVLDPGPHLPVTDQLGADLRGVFACGLQGRKGRAEVSFGLAVEGAQPSKGLLVEYVRSRRFISRQTWAIRLDLPLPRGPMIPTTPSRPTHSRNAFDSKAALPVISSKGTWSLASWTNFCRGRKKLSSAARLTIVALKMKASAGRRFGGDQGRWAAQFPRSPAFPPAAHGRAG